MKGTVKWFNDARGYGAIEPDDHDGVVYVHFTDIVTQGYKTLDSGMRVDFEIDESAEKYCAVEVCPENSTGRPAPERLA